MQEEGIYSKGGIKMKYEIWKKENRYVEKENGMILHLLIPSDEIEEAVYFSETCFLISGTDVNRLVEDVENETVLDGENTLGDLYYDRSYSVAYLDEDELQEFFQKHDYNVEVRLLSEWESVKEDGFLFFPQDFSFCKMSELETNKIYEYWDGSNWRILCLESYETAEEVVVSEDEVCLDRWDGSNFYTESKFSHQYVSKVLEIDGEKADDLYLLIEISDCQADIPVATILDKEDLKEYLKSINREMNDYIDFDDPRD